MAQILLVEREIDVFEEAEEVLSRILNCGEGVRRAGEIVAPPGWVLLTTPDTEDAIYVQVARIACVREG
jgi:hypothetical protein